jgi:hypothetical protein
MADFLVAASSDDAWEDSLANVVITATDPNVSSSEWHGFRFPGVTIPNMSVITSAVLTLYFTNSAKDDPDHDIYGEADDDAAAFQAITDDISSRQITTATVNWESSNLGAPGSFVSPDITSVVQEIVNRAGWASGNALAILISGSAPGSDMQVEHFDHASSNTPKLTVTWEPPDTDIPPSGGTPPSGIAGLSTSYSLSVDYNRPVISENAGFADYVTIGRIIEMAVQSENLGFGDSVPEPDTLGPTTLSAATQSSNAGFADSVTIGVNFHNILVVDNLGFGDSVGPPDSPAPTSNFMFSHEETVYFTQDVDEKQSKTANGSTITILAGGRYRR